MNEIDNEKQPSAFAQRKAKAKTLEHTVIKSGFHSCKNADMAVLVDEAVNLCSSIACQASLLTSYHIIRLLENNIELPPMDNPFFYQTISAIANLDGSKKVATPELTISLREFLELYPNDFTFTAKKPYMTQMLNTIGQTARQNFQVSMEMTFQSSL